METTRTLNFSLTFFSEDLEWTEWYYMKPWTRCPPYIIGIGLVSTVFPH